MAARTSPAADAAGRLLRELGGDPIRPRLVILVPRCCLQRLFRGIHRQVPLVILFGCSDRVKRNRYILRVHSEEATDRYNEGADLAVITDEYVNDLADLAVGGIIDILLVVIGYRRCIGRESSQDVSLSCGNARGGRCGLLCLGGTAHGGSDRGSHDKFISYMSLHYS
jgi:hypothetical protein